MREGGDRGEGCNFYARQDGGWLVSGGSGGGDRDDGRPRRKERAASSRASLISWKARSSQLGLEALRNQWGLSGEPPQPQPQQSSLRQFRKGPTFLFGLFQGLSGELPSLPPSSLGISRELPLHSKSPARHPFPALTYFCCPLPGIEWTLGRLFLLSFFLQSPPPPGNPSSDRSTLTPPTSILSLSLPPISTIPSPSRLSLRNFNLELSQHVSQ